jgi:hypothetical protein
VLHDNVPVYPEAVSVDVPLQLLMTDTVGAIGVGFTVTVTSSLNVLSQPETDV